MRSIRLFICSLASTFALILAGCGGSSGGGTIIPPPPPAISVAVAPHTASVAVSTATQQFSATVSNTTNTGVNWSLSSTGLTCTAAGSPCGSVPATSTSGAMITYTAPSTVPASTVILTASSAADSTKTDFATITVTGPPAISVTISPVRGGLILSQSTNFTATVANDPANAGVTWTTSSGTIGSPTAFTATYTAPPVVPGLITVTATSVTDPTQTATATLGITDLSGVSTYHNDLSRDGVNAQEYALTTANVNKSSFGKLFSCTADGAIYAQPLWVPKFSGISHNLVIVATQHDSVFAFDADINTTPCTPLWQVSLLAAGETSVPSGQNNGLIGAGYGDITPEVGITGTPVIDPNSNTLYVVSKSMNAANLFFQRLHALDLASGAEKFNGPVVISASVAGTGDASSGGIVAFDPQPENQRPGLALVNGVVYISWASHEDADLYHGWVMGYNASTLAQTAVFNDSPNGSKAGIWMGGGAPAADSNGYLYFLTGNGTFDADGGGSDYGDSTVKLDPGMNLAVADSFTPNDESTLEGNDTDHGSGGAAILVDQPNPPMHLIIGGGKEGNLFLLNRDSMGGYGQDPQNSNTVQVLNVGGPVFATAAFWNGSLYIAPLAGPLQAYPFVPIKGQFSQAQSTSTSAKFNFPGATPSISATGSTNGTNGIVWAIDSSQYCTPQSKGCGPAVLHAFDATKLTSELWNSSQVAADVAGFAVKFTVPTIANGKVYIGTRGNDPGPGTSSIPGELDVYGLKPN